MRVRLPLESVPNFSDGRSMETIAALHSALAGRAEVLDVHADGDHNRSVFTLVGHEPALEAGLLGLIACARDRIDLSRHAGAHRERAGRAGHARLRRHGDLCIEQRRVAAIGR